MNYIYLIEDPNIIAQYKEMQVKRKEFLDMATKFAESYNAKPQYSLHGKEIYFSGIIFNRGAEVDYDVWTKPSNGSSTSHIRYSKSLKKSQLEKIDNARIEYNSRLIEYFGELAEQEDKVVKTRHVNDFMKNLFNVGANEWVSFKFEDLDNLNKIIYITDSSCDRDYLIELKTSEYFKLYNENKALNN